MLESLLLLCLPEFPLCVCMLIPLGCPDYKLLIILKSALPVPLVPIAVCPSLFEYRGGQRAVSGWLGNGLRAFSNGYIRTTMVMLVIQNTTL